MLRQLLNGYLSRMEGEMYLVRGLLGPLQDLLFLFFLGHGLLCRCVAGARALEHLILGRSRVLVLDRTFRRFLWRRGEFLLNPLHRIPITGGRSCQVTSGMSESMTYPRRLCQCIPGWALRPT